MNLDPSSDFTQGEVVGFQGPLDIERTPTLREPIYRRERPPGSTDLETPGGAILLPSPWPAESGHQILALSEREIVMQASAPEDLFTPTLERLDCWLGGVLPRDARRHLYLSIVTSAPLYLVYGSRKLVSLIRETLRDRIKAVLERAFGKHDRQAILRASWWLSHAALRDADLRLASAGLALAGDLESSACLLESTHR